MPHIYNALSKGLVSPLHFIFMPPSTTTKVLQVESQQCHWGKSLQAEAEGVSLFTIENMGKLMSLSGRGQRTSRGGGQWIQAFYLSGGFMHRPLPIFHLVSDLSLLLSPLSLSLSNFFLSNGAGFKKISRSSSRIYCVHCQLFRAILQKVLLSCFNKKLTWL